MLCQRDKSNRTLECNQTLTDLNKAGMEEWRRLPVKTGQEESLAEFPGTIYLGEPPFQGLSSPKSSQTDALHTVSLVGDTRESDPGYPSDRLSGAEVARLEPELSPHFAEKGGRRYRQEGGERMPTQPAECYRSCTHLDWPISHPQYSSFFCTRHGRSIRNRQPT